VWIEWHPPCVMSGPDGTPIGLSGSLKNPNIPRAPPTHRAARSKIAFRGQAAAEESSQMKKAKQGGHKVQWAENWCPRPTRNPRDTPTDEKQTGHSLGKNGGTRDKTKKHGAGGFFGEKTGPPLEKKSGAGSQKRE